ncbi:ROK family transcriptional regulator [Bradyrhizobium sp. AZCC 2230]|uniref:ROK family transcriptional regulator n=1 Tax=Bradyrhizobium sp. AZCC 2230 TaxID=3117021 RepID=UPI002FF235EC
MQDAPSSPVARQQSVRLVVERLLRDRSVSRAEIARSTGLSKQTISEVMRDLERDGWVHEDGQIQGSVGRSAVTYALRPDAAFVLGIDLGGTKLHVALADLHGEIVAESIEPTSSDGGAAVVTQIERMKDALLQQASVSAQRLRGGVMGSPGMVDPASGSIVIAPNIPGLDSLDVRAALRERLGIDIAIENDVNLAAIGEHWRGNSRKARSFAFVAVGTGIGMGIFSDGYLVRGARGAAGEIAYLPLGGDPYDARGLRYGTLETAIGSVGIIERYVGLGGSPGSTVRDVFDRLDIEEAARITIDEVSRILTTAILAVHSILDSEIIILGGSIGARPEMKLRIDEHLGRCMREPVRIELSGLGNRATLIGAIGSALDLVHRSLFGIGRDAGPLALPVSAADVAA